MQNLNDLENKQQVTGPVRTPQMPQMPETGQKGQSGVGNIPQVPEPGVRKKRPLSKYGKFFYVAFVIMLFIFALVMYISIVKEDTKARKQIQAGYEKALNSPQMQQYRSQQTKRQRELAKQRRLKQLGVEGVSQPMEKNDLLNQQIKKQELAQQEELTGKQKPQSLDYSAELEAYKARLKEVQEEEARLRAQAEAAARAEIQAQANEAREEAGQL